VRWFDPGAAWASSAEAASGQRAICGRRENMGGKMLMPKVKLTMAESTCSCGYFKKDRRLSIVKDFCLPLCHELWSSIYPFLCALQNGASRDDGDCRAKMIDAACRMKEEFVFMENC